MFPPYSAAGTLAPLVLVLLRLNAPLWRILTFRASLQHVRGGRRNSSRRSSTGSRSSLRSLVRWRRIQGRRTRHELFVRRRPADRGRQRRGDPASPAVGSAFFERVLPRYPACCSRPTVRSV